MSGEPHPLWFGSDVVGVGRNLVFLRSRQGDELYAVPYDF